MRTRSSPTNGVADAAGRERGVLRFQVVRIGEEVRGVHGQARTGGAERVVLIQKRHVPFSDGEMPRHDRYSLRMRFLLPSSHCLDINFFIGGRLRLAQQPLTDATRAKKREFTRRTTASHDGIGKVYMGREIAQVMGHSGAGWLDSSIARGGGTHRQADRGFAAPSEAGRRRGRHRRGQRVFHLQDRPARSAGQSAGRGHRHRNAQDRRAQEERSYTPPTSRPCLARPPTRSCRRAASMT